MKAPLGLVSVRESLTKKLEISKSRKIWTQNDIHWFLKVLYGPVPCSEWQLPGMVRSPTIPKGWSLVTHQKEICYRLGIFSNWNVDWPGKLCPLILRWRHKILSPNVSSPPNKLQTEEGSTHRIPLRLPCLHEAQTTQVRFANILTIIRLTW